MSVTIEISGLKEVVAKLSKVAPAVVQGAAEAGRAWEEEVVMPESMDECPKEIGDLQGSSYVNQPVISSEGIELTMGYSSPHALYTHEMLDPYVGTEKVFGMKMPVIKSVQWTKPGSKPKYLEDPFMRHADELPDEMAKGAADALEELAK